MTHKPEFAFGNSLTAVVMAGTLPHGLSTDSKFLATFKDREVTAETRSSHLPQDFWEIRMDYLVSDLQESFGA